MASFIFILADVTFFHTTMPEFKELSDRYAKFIKSRDWEQFHTPKNAAVAISVEAGELLECFLWHDNLDATRIQENPELMDAIRAEVADVLIYCMSLGLQLDIDLLEAIEEKLEQNEERFDEDRSTEIRENLQRWQE
jgi:NTP pyrophosphatase (non-canonical NTP hydrolase)